MPSKFDELCNLVIERAESGVQSNTTYGLNPEFDPSALTGFDKLVANFVEEKPATTEEIINVIKSNTEDGDASSAQEVLRNLIDAGIIVPKEAEETEAGEGEPNASELEKEPEVKVEEPETPGAAEEGEDEKEEGSAVPPPEEDEADTFHEQPVASRVADISPETDEVNDEEETDDTPASVLLKQEKRKKDQAAKLVRYLFSKRGKSPEEAEAYINHLASKGLA